MPATRWVHEFDQLDEVESRLDGGWETVRGLLGGKGANLAKMTELGIPVPPGFTVTTQACLRYLENDNTMLEEVWQQVLQALHAVENRVDSRFGDPTRPLLVSCRSGAKFSMPGMMDTVLNIGLNDQTAKGLVSRTGAEHFVLDSYRRLIQMFGTVVLGLRDELFENVLSSARTERGVSSDAELDVEDLRAIVDRFRDIATQFPTDPHEQLRMAIEAVFTSWNGKRAIDYRNAAGIPHDLGTAVNVQAMVFGNLGERSATGVAMTRSGATGRPGLEGDFLINAQGEDVVSGTRATRSIEDLAKVMPEAYAELQQMASTLETHYRDMQDIEFTIEDGKLWLLQTRDGKRTAQAAVRIAVDLAGRDPHGSSRPGLEDRSAVQQVSPRGLVRASHREDSDHLIGSSPCFGGRRCDGWLNSVSNRLGIAHRGHADLPAALLSLTDQSLLEVGRCQVQDRISGMSSRLAVTCRACLRSCARHQSMSSR